jgi:DNA-binding response OmpR family regulator
MRILVIEDDRKMAELIRKGLTEQGYKVDVVFNGRDGEQCIQIVHYDIVTLDIMLPDIDGFSLCQSIRQINRAVKILMLTAKDDLSDKIVGLDSGADDYLIKPFNFSELYAHLRTLARREGVYNLSHIKEAGGLIVDFEDRKVWQDGNLVDIKGKEYSVLECLMRRPGALVTRTMIEQYIREVHLEFKYNMVDVYICRLRSKLDKEGRDSLIETVRSIGYRLRVD